MERRRADVMKCHELAEVPRGEGHSIDGDQGVRKSVSGEEMIYEVKFITKWVQFVVLHATP